ncbi:MAG: hypothetical protein Q7V58_18075 [Actinomycetota bacterium]|nr:hypothetical protein [Actinomycetota bacterium]
MSEDKGKAIEVRRDRFYLYIAFLMIHFAVVSLLDPLLTEPDATIYEGLLSEIHLTRRYTGIQLSTADGDIEIMTTHGPDFLRSLEPHLGSEVKVWAYTRLNNFYIPEEHLIQLEVNNEKFIKNWDSVSSTGKKPRELYLIAIALVIFAFKIRSILKMLKGSDDASEIIK